MTESKAQPRQIAYISVVPKTDDDRTNLLCALDGLAREDRTIGVEAVADSPAVVIRGVGELHLDAICDRLTREYKLEFNSTQPRVIYVETIRKEAEAEGKYVRVVSRIQHYGHAKLRLVPLERGAGYEFVNEIADDVVPALFAQAVDLGVREAMKGGILAGNEIVDLRAVLCGGSYHADDSNEFAFKIAASLAFKQAARKASPVLLEPTMAIKVEIPEEYAGSVIGDLSLRRALIKGMEAHADCVVVAAEVPLAEIFGYPGHLRIATNGRANYTLDFSHYEECPWREDSGADEIGVTANKPEGPRTRRQSAVEYPNTET